MDSSKKTGSQGARAAGTATSKLITNVFVPVFSKLIRIFERSRSDERTDKRKLGRLPINVRSSCPVDGPEGVTERRHPPAARQNKYLLYINIKTGIYVPVRSLAQDDSESDSACMALTYLRKLHALAYAFCAKRTVFFGLKLFLKTVGVEKYFNMVRPFHIILASLASIDPFLETSRFWSTAKGYFLGHTTRGSSHLCWEKALNSWTPRKGKSADA
ncbi:hypothetical protein EVAR_89823_1 [Eumeta japonica]|uniref:Uncharacterized protein n=1 Tax=Eumeta variegata TaxID=151549 RepID=A0A4C1YFH2_EUMVA|nr:hypothetical protein EVAR_89823_1 [Eumeta japonica]